jgi:hypothetical protein
MNVSIELNSTRGGSHKARSGSPGGCDLDCQEELFGHFADRSQLSIMQTLCEGAKTQAQIASATGLSQRDIALNLDRLLGCGWVKAQNTGHLVRYGLSAPRLLQLEGIVDEMLVAALKHRRAP